MGKERNLIKSSLNGSKRRRRGKKPPFPFEGAAASQGLKFSNFPIPISSFSCTKFSQLARLFFLFLLPPSSLFPPPSRLSNANQILLKSFLQPLLLLLPLLFLKLLTESENGGGRRKKKRRVLSFFLSFFPFLCDDSPQRASDKTPMGGNGGRGGSVGGEKLRNRTHREFPYVSAASTAFRLLTHIVRKWKVLYTTEKYGTSLYFCVRIGKRNMCGG